MSIWILEHGAASLAQERIVCRESTERFGDGLGQGLLLWLNSSVDPFPQAIC